MWYKITVMQNLIKSILLISTVIVFGVAGAIWMEWIPLFQARVQYVPAGDARIAYYVRGEGKPLLLIPGFGMNMGDWDPQLIRSLSHNHQVIVYDFRGVGLSTNGSTQISVYQMRDDVIRVLDTLGIERADIIGWSLGSVVAQEVAAAYPDRVERLVLVSTFSADRHMVPAADEVSDAVQNNLGGSWEELTSFLFPQTEKGIQEKNKYLERRKDGVEKKIAPNVSEVEVETKMLQEEAMAVLATQDRTSLISSIPQPTLIIAGQKDVLIPIQNARWIKSILPQATLVEVENAGHAVLFERNNQVKKTLGTFLE